MAKMTLDVLQDLHLFNKNYFMQWVQIMNKLDFFESLGGLKPSLALTYNIHKAYWHQLSNISQWYIKAHQGQFSSEMDREEAQLEKIQKQMDELETIDWENYPIKNTFKEKLVPPILPGKLASFDQLKAKVAEYLCPKCCSHRVIRNTRTAPGCVDVLEIPTNPQNDDVVVPPLEKKSKMWFQFHSFICSCKSKALICETDQNSDFAYKKTRESYDPDASKSEITGDGVIVCNVRVLQVKTL